MLEAPGWEVASTESGDDGYGEVGYEKAGAGSRSPGTRRESYDSYVTDREHIVDPPAPGEPVEVLGRTGQLWAYDVEDHTVIREVEDGFWIEFRGSGMDEAGYRALLARAGLVGRRGYEASLPEDFVTTDERPAPRSPRCSPGITAATGAEGPDGAPVRVRSDGAGPLPARRRRRRRPTPAPGSRRSSNAVTHDQAGPATTRPPGCSARPATGRSSTR